MGKKHQMVSPYIKGMPLKAMKYDVFLDGPIGRPEEYRDLTFLLLNANEHDLVNFIINSRGGRLDTTQQIIEASHMSDASIQCTIVGQCHSGASMIALNCGLIVVTDSAEMMVHQATYGTGGLVGNVKTHSDFASEQIDKVLNETYTAFLTSKEMLQMKDGKEFWFNAEQIRERAKKRMNWLKKQAAKESETEDDGSDMVIDQTCGGNCEGCECEQ